MSHRAHLFSAAASRSNCATSAARQRCSSFWTARSAHSSSHTFAPSWLLSAAFPRAVLARGLSGGPVQYPAVSGASEVVGDLVRDHQKGVLFSVLHGSSFDRRHSVIQLVIPLDLLIEAPMSEQLELRLLCRLDAPSIVHPSEVAACKTYRDAVRLCWDKRKVRNMTKAMLAERAGLYAPHVTSYLEDSKRPRDLPGWAVPGFERACDNAAISQWIASRAQLTVAEEMTAMRATV